jgi:hypothetical protein
MSAANLTNGNHEACGRQFDLHRTNWWAADFIETIVRRRI